MKKKRGIEIKINFSKRWLYTFIVIGILAIVGLSVYAYSGDVGHTSDQIDETDPTVLASVKDGIAWNEISNRPAGLDDGDDVGGGTSLTKGTAIYRVSNSHCNDAGHVVYSSTCQTSLCPPRFEKYHTCSGSCTRDTAATCSNTLEGYLVD